MPEFTLPHVDAETALARAARGDALLVDVRKTQAAIKSGETLRGAIAHDPFSLNHDHPLTADPRPLLVFCVHGHEVSQFACALLRMHDRDACYVAGGFDALKSAGAHIVPLGGTDAKA